MQVHIRINATKYFLPKISIDEKNIAHDNRLFFFGVFANGYF